MIKKYSQIHKFYFDQPDIWEKLRIHSLSGEISFIKHFFPRGNEKILDVGCGSGLHCGGLSKLGYKMYGVDLNPAMIKFAQSHYQTSQFYIGDMRNLDILGFQTKFKGVICLCTTFTYNLTNREVDQVLSQFYTHLRKGGVLIIEVFNPISFLQKIKLKNSFFLEDPNAYSKLGFKIEVKHEVDESAQTVKEAKRIYDSRNGNLLKEDRTIFRMFFPQEIIYFLDKNGFKTLGQWGRYNLKYENLDRTRMITVAEKV